MFQESVRRSVNVVISGERNACAERRTVEDLLLSAGGALGGRGESHQNELTPLVAEDLDALIEDILDRTTHRSGMILSVRPRHPH